LRQIARRTAEPIAPEGLEGWSPARMGWSTPGWRRTAVLDVYVGRSGNAGGFLAW